MLTEQSPKLEKMSAYKRRAKRLSANNWTTQHTAMLRLVREGMSNGDIASKLSVSQNTVTNTKNSDYFKERLAAYNIRLLNSVQDTAVYRAKIDEARNTLTAAAPQAAATMVTLSKIGTKEDKVKFDAAKDILDRAGLKPVEVIEARERVYSPEEMLKAQGTLRETETIITRLSQTTSTFILGDSSMKAGPKVPLESPLTTDTGSDVPTTQDTNNEVA